MVEVKGLGNCEIIGTDEFSITVVLEGENVPRYLDREDYPELSAECAYEKQITDMVKDSAQRIKPGEFVYVNVFDGFEKRMVSPTEIRTKIEDYLITFEALNGEVFMDDLDTDGNGTLVSRRVKGNTSEFSGVIASIEQMYITEEV